MIDIQSISEGLQLGEHGIWYSTETQDLSYPADGNEACFAIEDQSFWFKHRNRCILSAVQSYPPEGNGAIVDVGGGNGYVSWALASAGFQAALLEPGRAGAFNARRRGLETVICATTDTARLKPQSLSAVGLFDVVEHIEDDLSFLRSIGSLMKKGARLYVTVPAYDFLWSQEDISAGHFRRYTITSICEAIGQAGFEIEFSSYIFRFLPILIALFRALPYRMGLRGSEEPTRKIAREHAVNGGIVARMLDSTLQAEIARLNNRRAMSFGGSCLVVAKCP